MIGGNLLLTLLEADYHVRFTLLYRLWVIVSGGVTILCTPFWFNPIEQGYFYTFSSLVAAQVLFELGTSFVITQLTAHEIASRRNMSSGIEVDPLDRVALILRFSDRWFARASLSFVIVIGGFGWVFFSTNGILKQSDWSVPWGLLVIASAFTLRLTPRMALLEGAGEIGQVARVRLGQSIVGNVLMWTLLFAGMRLWALPIVPVISVLFSATWLRRHALIGDLNARCSRGIACLFDWRTEVYPLQWRIALSWASGYLIFQAISPIVFATLGTVAAGQVGLSIAIFNGVQTMGMSWMYSKTPRYAELIARNERQLLNAEFLRSLRRTVAIVAFGAMLVLGCVWILNVFQVELANRVPELPALACFAATAVGNAIVFSLALYMRSHKEEPLLTASIVGGLLTVVAVYSAASLNLFAVALSYMTISVGVGLPWAWLLFRPYYRRQTQHG